MLKWSFSKSESVIVLRSTLSGLSYLFVINALISLQLLNVSRHLSFLEPMRCYSTVNSSLLSFLAPRSPVSCYISKTCYWCWISSSSLSYNSSWLPCRPSLVLSVVLFEFYEFDPLLTFCLESNLRTPEEGRIGLCYIFDEFYLLNGIVCLFLVLFFIGNFIGGWFWSFELRFFTD